MQINSLDTKWNVKPAAFDLNANDVHVWRVSSGAVSTTQYDRLWSILSSDEVERAMRFQRDIDRERFVVTRGTLRDLLCRYLNCQPHGLAFSYNRHGKPSLDKSIHAQPLTFNLAHSNELALVAIAWNRRIGIDIEFIREDVDVLQIANQIFSPREYSWLLNSPDEQRITAFFGAWVRKEAYGKARGEGLPLLQAIDVTLLVGDPAEIVETSGDPEQARLWQLLPISPGTGYVGALAVEGRGWQESYFQW